VAPLPPTDRTHGADGSFRSELFAFADAFIERTAALNPIAATDFGIDRYDDELTDFSLAHRARRRTSSVRRWPRSRHPTTDDIDRIGKAVMVERLTATLGLEESGETRRTFSVLGSPASAIRQVFDLQPAETPEHAEKIRSRLAAVRRSLESWRGALDEDSRGGLVAGRRQALGVATPARHLQRGAFRAWPSARRRHATWTPRRRAWRRPAPTPTGSAASWPLAPLRLRAPGHGG
jgi:uncharacterized protein (DUF885 family)